MRDRITRTVAASMLGAAVLLSPVVVFASKDADAHAAEAAAAAPASFTDALAAAKQQDKPLLVIAYPGDNAAIDRRVKTVLKAPEVAAALNDVVSYVMDTHAAPAEQNKALDDYRTAHRLRKTPVAMLVIGPDQKLVSSYLSTPTVGAVVAKVRQVAAKPAAYAGGWVDDFQVGLKLARQLHRPMLLDFTGSDWCPWCMKLDKEVFATPQFQQYAQQHLVLVRVDFPHNKPQSPQIKQQNQQLASKYKIRGFPTTVVVNTEGAVLGQLGYQPGGPTPWIKHLSQYVR